MLIPAVMKHMPKLLNSSSHETYAQAASSAGPIRFQRRRKKNRIRRRQVIIFVQFEVLRKMPGTSADWLVYHGLIVGLWWFYDGLSCFIMGHSMGHSTGYRCHRWLETLAVGWFSIATFDYQRVIMWLKQCHVYHPWLGMVYIYHL